MDPTRTWQFVHRAWKPLGVVRRECCAHIYALWLLCGGWT